MCWGRMGARARQGAPYASKGVKTGRIVGCCTAPTPVRARPGDGQPVTDGSSVCPSDQWFTQLQLEQAYRPLTPEISVPHWGHPMVVISREARKAAACAAVFGSDGAGLSLMWGTLSAGRPRTARSGGSRRWWRSR